MSPIEVQVITKAGIAIASVSGEVDLDVRDRFVKGLAPVRDGEGPAVLDLGAVSFMDSTGLHVVVQLWRGLRREGRALALACPAPAVRRLLELTSLDRELPVYDDADVAVEALRRCKPRVSADPS